MSRGEKFEARRILVASAAVACLAVVALGGSFVLRDHEARAAARARNAITTFERIELDREICYGTCPIYRLVVYGDGRVVYDGYDFVKVAGHAEGRISPAQINELAAEVNRAEFFRLGPRYASATDGCPTTWTDAPTVFVAVEAQGHLGRIEHYHGCREKGAEGERYPPELVRLENRIDEIVGVKKWLGERSERPKEMNICHTTLATSPPCDP